MKLISMTDHVLGQYNKRMDTPYKDGALTESDAERWVKYAKFLKTPLELGMFVPCNEDGRIYDEDGTDGEGNILDEIMYKEYQQAKERVLFEGFIFVKALTAFGESEYYRFMYEETIITNLDFKNKTVEDLIEKYSITLTQNTVKKYGI